MNKMNLTFIVAHLKAGGQEMVAARMSHILKGDYNIRMMIIDGRDMNYIIDCEYKCMNIYPSSNPVMKVVNAIRRIIRAKKIKKEWRTDICLSFGETCNYINTFSRRKETVLLSIHNYRSIVSPKSLKKVWLNIVYKKAHGIICISKNIVEMAKDTFKKHILKFKLLYNPYDRESISALKGEELSQYNYFFTNSRVIISVGTHRCEKGYWHLVKAFSLAKANFTDVKLFIMGPEQPGFVDKLNRLISGLGLSGEVALAGFDENPFKYMSRSTMYVMSSITEGFPNVLLEAMACGLPVISADCKSGPREMLSDGDPFTIALDIEYQDYGLLVPPMTLEENYDPGIIEECERTLARAVELYLSDTVLAEDYAQRAFTGANRFSYAVFRDCFIKIVEECNN